MLDSLRNAARSWVVKALMLLLVVSFGVWGIERSLVAPGSDTVMTVGDQQISSEEFRLAYQRQLANIGRQFGQPLTPDQARASASRTRFSPSSQPVRPSISSRPT